MFRARILRNEDPDNAKGTRCLYRIDKRVHHKIWNLFPGGVVTVPRQNYDLLRNQSDRSVAGFAGSSVSNWDRKSLSVKSRLNGTSSCLDSKAMKRLAGGILARDNSKGMTRDARERFKDASTNAASARLPPKGLRSNSKKLPVPWWKV